MNTTEEMLQFDRNHLWHPYTSMIDPLPVYFCKKAKKEFLYLESGEKLIDGMSSWWCAIHGYGNKKLNKSIKKQIKKMSHVMFGGITHTPAIELGKSLLEIVPAGLNKIFYCDSGSVSVEVALKMAIQYQAAQSKSSKNQIATISGGYHGDTWHAMSVCDPVGGMHTLYNGRLTAQHFVPKPLCRFDQEWNKSDFAPMQTLLEENHSTIAAVILEPIVQGAGGMYFYHPTYLKELRELCTKLDIVLIADEIATGFGRSGKMFACQWADITPDIICIGKALTGGMMSFAATIATTNIATTISSASPKEFMHGPTFMANPLAAATACQSLKMIKEGDTLNKVAEIEKIMIHELSPLKNLSTVADVRILGAIGVVEMKKAVDMGAIQKMFVDRGAWVRPFGKLVYIMPPYIISNKSLTKLCHIVCDVVALQS